MLIIFKLLPFPSDSGNSPPRWLLKAVTPTNLPLAHSCSGSLPISLLDETSKASSGECRPKSGSRAPDKLLLNNLRSFSAGIPPMVSGISPDYRLNNRFGQDAKGGSEKPDFRRWTRQENFGGKTWKEATASTAPKMVGERLYGVRPVLAALSAKRREFYALHVQEGLFLCSNNRKRKDKKGFEKVLKLAENIGMGIQEASKHDLNKVVHNRPHQGLVLDASPLEMVKIKELDPISTEEHQVSLWVALDEVTDPHNLGAIIRSAYFFFGASGVVLCAKISAPLSGVVSKSSAGSLELMDLRYCNNMMQFLVSSAENGWRVLGGSVSSKSVALNEIPPGPPTILVLGSEGTGLRPLVERSCTHLVGIPVNIPVDVTAVGVDEIDSDVHYGSSPEQFQSFMAVESLNVSVAAGVLLHHLTGHHCNSNRPHK